MNGINFDGFCDDEWNPYFLFMFLRQVAKKMMPIDPFLK